MLSCGMRLGGEMPETPVRLGLTWICAQAGMEADLAKELKEGLQEMKRDIMEHLDTKMQALGQPKQAASTQGQPSRLQPAQQAATKAVPLGSAPVAVAQTRKEVLPGAAGQAPPVGAASSSLQVVGGCPGEAPWFDGAYQAEGTPASQAWSSHSDCE